MAVAAASCGETLALGRFFASNAFETTCEGGGGDARGEPCIILLFPAPEEGGDAKGCDLFEAASADQG